jgi:hypothetical protein
MSRRKTSKYEADPPPPEPFLTAERKKVYLLIAAVDALLMLAIALVAIYRFVPPYPTAPAIAFVMVVFNYAVLFVKRDVLLNRDRR